MKINIGMNLDEKIEKLDVIGVVLRPNSPYLKDYVVDLVEFLKTKNIQTLIDIKSANMIGVGGVSFKTMCQKSNMLLSIGGDGTLISLARRSLEFKKPIMGINMGKLGFLTDFKANTLKQSIDNILDDNYRIDVRMVIDVNATISGYNAKFRAINDIVIRHKKAKMMRVKLYIDNELVNNYYGDGLIISTPTGATGYNLSANGPIVFPYAKNFIFTPICPHSLTQRPLVLPVNFDIKIVAEDDDCMALLDGQDSFTLNNADEISFKMADFGAKMIHRKERNFFKVISEKLNWGD